MQTLSYFPGQKCTLFLETKDGYGSRVDGYFLPSVDILFLPDKTLATGYPKPMTHLSQGLYYYEFTLPTGSTSVGNYLADVSFINLTTNELDYQLYQIIVSSAYGNWGIAPQ